MLKSREYRGESDYQGVRELLIESYAITGRMHNWGIDCWDWFRYNGKVLQEIANQRCWESDIQLWETERGMLVGVVIYDEGDIFIQVHPQYRHIEGEMLAWAEEHHHASRPKDVEQRPLSTYVYDYDTKRQALLKSSSYELLGQDSYMRRRSLDQSIPEFSLPGGYKLRSLDGLDLEDLEKRAALANNAFDITKHTAQTIQMLQKAPTYLPELDLVVVAANGIFAAYCVIWFDKVNQIGMFGPVGTHRDHRKRGLGKAMMSDGLARLTSLNAKMAYVDCDLDNAANRLYASVGFCEYDRIYHWQKE